MGSPKRRLEAVGYWFNDLAPSSYPRPQRLVGAWRRRDRTLVLAHLRSGVVFESYRAKSFCRFRCGVTPARMGHRDLTDGLWVWPEGLAHYVEAHSVRLPERFVAHAIAHPDARTAIVPAQRDGSIDEASWLAWGRQQGAALDLSSWTAPDRATQQEIVAQIKERMRGDPPWRYEPVVLLARKRTREVVCLLRSGQLAIVRLGKTTTLRILSGWDEWSDEAA